MIETWGRGLGVIAGECKRAGLVLPETAMRWGYVITTFKRPRIDESGSNLDQNLDHADPDPIQIDPDMGGDIPRRLLSTLRRNPLISRKLLADELNVSERKIRDSLKILKDSGVIVRQGPDHGGIWRISHMVGNTSRREVAHQVAHDVAQSKGPVVAQSWPSRVFDAISSLNEASTSDLATALALDNSSGSLKRALRILLADGIIEYTIPQKPRSRLQKYRLTEKGRQMKDLYRPQ